MKRRLLEWLRCPASRERLDLHVLHEARVPVAAGQHDGGEAEEADVREGFLHCPASGLVYPIIAGVPRLLRTAFTDYREFYYRHRQALGSLEGQEEIAERLGRADPRRFDRRSQESFSHQWEQYQYQDRTWFKDDLNLRAEEFLTSMQLSAAELEGKLVLDAGCRNGRLTASVTRYGCEVIGLDFSRSIERAAANAPAIAGPHADRVHFVQGNILEPPFAVETFDHGHTSGVLHHTPDPREALHQFVQLIRPGGQAYVQLYRYRADWAGRLTRLVRFFTTRLPVWMVWQLCLAAVPLHTALVRLVARCRGEETIIHQASYRERAVSLFDNFSPPYQFRYTPEQFQAMMAGEGLTNLHDVTLANEARHMVAFVGTKP
jgi:SAM-dependent methyltransferase/uncharacterized protein YbaR (Trm112 family)